MTSKPAGGDTPATPFNEFLGTRLLHRAEGLAQVSLDLGAHHKNRRGVAHGGVVCALLDSALGAAVVSTLAAEEWCATLQLSVSFAAGPRDGTIVATGRVTRRARRLAFAEGDLKDASGNVLATGQGVWHIWPALPPAK